MSGIHLPLDGLKPKGLDREGEDLPGFTPRPRLPRHETVGADLRAAGHLQFPHVTNPKGYETGISYQSPYEDILILQRGAAI